MGILDGANPLVIKVSIGMLRDENVVKAISTLVLAMGKAQESINAQMEQQMREAMAIEKNRGPFGGI